MFHYEDILTENEWRFSGIFHLHLIGTAYNMIYEVCLWNENRCQWQCRSWPGKHDDDDEEDRAKRRKTGNRRNKQQIKQETQLSLTNRATHLEVSQGHQTWYHVRYGFLLVCYSNFVHNTRRFFRYSTSKMSWPGNPRQRSLKVIESGTIR